MSQALSIEKFLIKAKYYNVIDVRTPAEFKQGHIPNAINIPLFSNEERAIVGTIYKKEDKNSAIAKGLELLGPRMATLANEIQSHVKENKILIHCWRGGMRSASVAWLLELFGVETFTLIGGYKAFRKKVLSSFEEQKNIIIIGGNTGSGKTEILHELKRQGHSILDLERHAKHKGSAFGGLFTEDFFSQEHFENLLAYDWMSFTPNKVIFIEDESRNIGRLSIPNDLWIQMRNAQVLYIDLPFEIRAKRLLKEYGILEKEKIQSALNRIQRRLGGLNYKQATASVENNDILTAVQIALKYYDKGYAHGLSKRDPKSIYKISFEQFDLMSIVNKIVKHI